jgi:hypothetical protein
MRSSQSRFITGLDTKIPNNSKLNVKRSTSNDYNSDIGSLRFKIHGGVPMTKKAHGPDKSKTKLTGRNVDPWTARRSEGSMFEKFITRNASNKSGKLVEKKN